MREPATRSIDLRDVARWLVIGGPLEATSTSWEDTRLLIVRVLLLSRVVFLSIPLALNWGEPGMTIGIVAVLIHGCWLLARGGSPMWAIAIDVPFITFAVLIGGMGSLAVVLLMLYLTVARVGLPTGRLRLVGTVVPIVGLTIVTVAQATRLQPLATIGTVLGVALVSIALVRVLESIEAHRSAVVAEAEVRAQERSETLAMIAHELSTPLTTGRGAIELMEETISRADNRELLGLVSGALHDSSILVSDLRAAVDLERGHIELELAPFSLAEFGREIKVSHPASRIEVDIAEGLAIADRTRVSQIVHNLISNAERHGRPPISIVGRNGGPMWSLSVTDQGDGIPLAEHESIFGSFAQGSHHGEGMGMGLSVSRKLARAMDGDLVVDDRCTDGTRFVLRLPSANHPTTKPSP